MNPNIADRDDLVGLLTEYDEALRKGSDTSRLDKTLSEIDDTDIEEIEELRRFIGLVRRSRPGHSDRSDSIASNPTVPDSDAARRIGRFEIMRELGRGGWGVVFLAYDPALKREVALKVPRPETLVTGGLRVRFLREAEAAARLNHPAVVGVHEAGETGGIYYIASQYVEGGSLSEWLRGQDELLSPTAAAELVAVLADAVQHAHECGILHRDIKPSNVLLEHGPVQGKVCELPFTPKLSDFGLAKILESETEATRTGTLIGTPSYMSPEQAEGRIGDIGPGTDVYALGVVLYELLCGRPPIRGESDVDTLRRVTVDEPTPPRRLRHEISADLEAVCQKCLEKSPFRRYPRAGDLAADLRSFLEGKPVSARSIGPMRRLTKWSRRRPAAATLLGVTAVATITLVVGTAWYNAQLAAALSRAEQSEKGVREALVRAEQSEDDLRDALYAADVSLAAEAYDAGDIRQAVNRLQRHVPEDKSRDVRGFEWYLLNKRVSHTSAILPHPDAVYGVRFTPDGQMLVTACADGQVRLWNAHKGALESEFNTGHGEVNGVSLDANASRIVTAGEDGALRVWDLNSRDCIVEIPRSHEGQSFQAEFLNDGQQLASCGDDPVIKLWDVATGQRIGTLEGHTKAVESLAVCSDGRLLASAGGDMHVILWDVESQTKYTKLGKTDHRISRVDFCPSAPWLASATASGQVRFSDARSGSWLRPDLVHLDGIYGLAIHPLGRMLASGDGSGVVRLWDLERWLEDWTMRPWFVPYQVISCSRPDTAINFGSSVALSGDLLVVGDTHAVVAGNAEAGAVDLYQHEDGAWSHVCLLVPKESKAKQRFGSSVSIAKDGEFIVVGAFRDNDPGVDNGAAYVFAPDDAGTWRQVARLVPDRVDHRDFFGSSVATDGTIIAVAADRAHIGDQADAGTVSLFERNEPSGHDWRMVQKLSSETPEYNELFGARLALSGNRLAVTVLRAQDKGIDAGAVEIFVRARDGRWVNEVRLAPDDLQAGDQFGHGLALEGTTLVASARRQNREDDDTTGAVYIFELDADRWQQTAKLHAHDPRRSQEFGYSVVLDDGLLAISSTTEIDHVSSEAVHLFSKVADGQRWIEVGVATPSSITPGSRHKVLDLEQGTLVVGDPSGNKSDRRIGEVDIYSLPERKRRAELAYELSARPDLVSLEDAIPMAGRWQAHKDRVWSLAFSPDGEFIASSGGDGDVKIWPTTHRLPRLQLAPPARAITFVDCAAEADVMVMRDEEFIIEVIRDGHSIRPLQQPRVSPNFMAVSEDGSRLAVSDAAAFVQILSTDTGEAVQTWPLDRADGLAWSPDGKRLVATSSSNGAVYLLDAQTDAEPSITKAFDPLYPSFVNGGVELAVKSGNDILLFDVATGEQNARLAGHRYAVHAVTWSSTANRLFTTSGDRSAGIWNLSQGILEARIDLPDSEGFALAVSPDGRTLATGHREPNVQLWHVATGQLLLELPLRARASSIHFTHDGRRLIINQGDGSVTAFDISE